jgi:hypothetical protein
MIPEVEAMLANYLRQVWQENPSGLLFPNRNGRPRKRQYIVKSGEGCVGQLFPFTEVPTMCDFHPRLQSGVGFGPNFAARMASRRLSKRTLLLSIYGIPFTTAPERVDIR